MRKDIQRESRWFIELHKLPYSKDYTGEIYLATKPEKKEPLQDLKLGPQVGVRIKGIDTTLGEILRVLEERGATSSNPQDEKIFDALSTMEGQRDLGEYLYDQIWPNTALDDIIEKGPSGGEVNTHITILACDDHTARLPWVLMGCEGKKMVLDRDIGVSVSLSKEPREEQLGPMVTFLIAAPNFETEDTGAEEHIQDIKMRLVMENELWDQKNSHHQVITVETWEEFKSMVREQKPKMVYYYGHADQGRLAFPDIPVKGRFGAASVDFAAFFRDTIEKRDRPKVVYVNCCRGHQGGNINLGSMLTDLFPVLVINRTVAYTEAAQNQAISFFTNLLNHGVSPHEAVLRMYRTKNISFDDIQWWTPVFYRNYSTFTNCVEQEGGPWAAIKDWDKKIDRTKQYSMIHTGVQGLIRQKERGASAFVWYGDKGQGIPEFTQRLEIQLPEDLDLDRNNRQDFLVVRPEWPPVKTERGFIESICKAFEVRGLRSIPAKISGEQRDRFNQGGPFLVIVSHQTILSGNEWTSNDLKTYLTLWDDIIPLLDKGQYLLIGISYEDTDYRRIGSVLEGVFGCPKIQDKELMDHGLEAIFIPSNLYQLELLDPLIHLNVRDIVDILRKIFPEKRPERLAKVANYIHGQTGGHYMKTVSALQKLRDCFFYEI